MPDTELVAAALSGERGAVLRFVQLTTPVIQARVARALMRRAASARGRDTRQEVEDMTQEVFASLFAREGRVLRKWDPERGLSLLNFVGLLAEREVASIMRSGRRSPWTMDPTEDEELERLDPPRLGPEARTAARELLEKLLDRLRDRLSPLGLEMFRRLYVQDESTEVITAEMGMKDNTVHAWRSRLRKAVRAEAAALMSESTPTPRTPDGRSAT